VGEVKGDKLVIKNLLDLDVDKLKRAYHGVIEEFMA